MKKCGGVGRIKIDRPESINSLTIDVMRELEHALKLPKRMRQS